MTTKQSQIESYIESNPGHGWRRIARALGISKNTVKSALRNYKWKRGIAPAVTQYVPQATAEDRAALIRRMLSKGPMTPAQITRAISCTARELEDALAIIEASHNIDRLGFGGMVIAPPPFGRLPLSCVDAGEWHQFGLVADTHLGCQEERLAELHLQYDLFKSEGIKRVLHAGNMVDGFIPKINAASATHITPDGQIEHVIDNYPRREGIDTYYITGDDHEGWWIKSGYNWGRDLEQTARSFGREDLHYIGHVESDVTLEAASGARTIIKVQHPGGGSAYARSYTGQKQVECVPLNSEILTKDGWKTHDQVVIGESVMGFNVQTGKCEWTHLIGVNYGEAEVFEFSNDQFSVECTENHKWAQEIEQRAGPNKNSKTPQPYSRKYLELAPIGHTKRRARIIQAAKCPGGEGLQHMEYDDYLRRPEAPSRVMQMTSGERRAFIEALLIAEGHRCVFKKQRREQIGFSQNLGPVLDAFRLACFLEGMATTEHSARGGSFKPTASNNRRVTVCTKTKRMCNGRYLKKKSIGVRKVWCPTTGLGTWVMRQGTLITITGNSFQGGEKPHILIQGHYHVSNYMNDRNVHVVNLPGFQDQTVFARKKRLRMEVGGAILRFKTNPDDGSVTRFSIEFNMSFNRGYYKPYLRSDCKLSKGLLIREERKGRRNKHGGRLGRCKK